MKSQKTPREYLQTVLKWQAFCKGHRRFEEAIKEILRENELLKIENERLKGKEV